MAKPVQYRVFTPADAREELKRRIDAAPLEHADALLGAYDLLEQAHKSGTLQLLRGLLSAQDAVITHVSDVLSSPEMVNALRNLLVVGKLLGNINPTQLQAAMVGEQQGRPTAPPSLLSLMGRMGTADARRGLNVATGLLTALGAAMTKIPEDPS
jgi:uncharacterized protein YjgD (DUF1641 family)